MLQVNISPVSSQDYHRLVEVHNSGFVDHIRKYGRFSGMKDLSAREIDEWRSVLLFDPSGLLKAQVKRNIVGYCYANIKREANEKGEFCTTGHLERMGDSCSLLCVTPSWRGKGIGSLLLANAEQFFRSKGFRFVVAWVYKSDLSARKFLEKGKYKHHREFFVEDFSKVLPLNADIEFWKKDLAKKLLPNGVKLSLKCSVRPSRKGDEVHFASIHNRIWCPYGRQVLTAEDARRRIHNQRIEQVFFAELDGRPVGGTEVHRDGSTNLVGVIPEYRRRGIGAALLLKTLEYLKRKGHKVSYMATGVPLRAALALYEKLGYRKIEELHCMVKELT